MKKGFWIFLLVLFLVSSVAFPACAQKMGIITGGTKGTYYQFGLNLKNLVEQQGIDLNVISSKGSIENIYAVYKRPHTQMGIVQSDVLAFISRVQTNPVLKRVAKKTRLVFPLYNEEVHLLGRKDISNFDDLTDKRVAIGKEGSGTYLTARLFFEVSDIRPKEMVTIGTGDALTELKAGRIDAMFYVAGLPVKLFREDVTAEDGLAFIPVLNKSITEFYPKVEIPANTYQWQTKPVTTVAVKAVLVAFNFRRANCEYVGRFAKILSDNIDWLGENGHSKWKQVDLKFPLKGWEQYDCVKKYIEKRPPTPKKSSPEINPIMDAVKDILG